MTSAVLFALMAVIAVWALAAFFIWQWGPGVRERSVWCPVHKRRATVLVQQKEALFVNSYAGLSVVDVNRCSLFRSGPLGCHKECLQRM
jgi:hypothetical protein